MPYPGKRWGHTGRAWRDCSRCGFSYPLSHLIRQNGVLVCSGAETNECFDEKNAQWYFVQIRYPRREGFDPEPAGPGDVNF